VVGYPDGTEPIITLGELAELWDVRLADPPEGDPGEVEEIDAPEDIDYLEEGKALLEQGKWQQAVEALTQAIELDSQNVEAYYYRGLAHYQLGAEPTTMRRPLKI
jgi:tetratricopeptide (TPR) repeat protein